MDPSVTELCHSFSSLRSDTYDCMSAGRTAIQLRNTAELEKAIAHGAHLEDLTTTAIISNNLEHLNILVDNGAKIFPSDFELPMTDAVREYLSYCYRHQ